MDETYRMLDRERQADLEREARKRHLAAVARAVRPDDANVSEKPARKRVASCRRDSLRSFADRRKED